MSDLPATATRLALLRDVAAGRVRHDPATDEDWCEGAPPNRSVFSNQFGPQQTKVTARMRELLEADLAMIARGYVYKLTDAGRAVLGEVQP